MATVVRLENDKTGEVKTLYSVDARELMARDKTWRFKSRLPRTQRKAEVGTSVVEGVKPATVDPLTSQLKEVPAEVAEAPTGTRGGGKREAPKAAD